MARLVGLSLALISVSWSEKITASMLGRLLQHLSTRAILRLSFETEDEHSNAPLHKVPKVTPPLFKAPTSLKHTITAPKDFLDNRTRWLEVENILFLLDNIQLNAKFNSALSHPTGRVSTRPGDGSPNRARRCFLVCRRFCSRAWSGGL